MILTMGVIDMLAPQHDRTSCTDEHTFLENAYKNDMGYPRCTRCYFMLNAGMDTAKLDMGIVILLRPKEDCQ